MKYKNLEHYEKLSRKEKMKRIPKNSTEAFELSEDKWAKHLEQGFFAARVVEVHKKFQFVSPEPELKMIDTHDVWMSTIARRHLQGKQDERNPLCVGDRVLCRKDGFKIQDAPKDLPQCLVEYRAPRSCLVSRQDPMSSRIQHVLACNMEQLVVVASYLHPKLKWGLIDRFLILAENEGLPCTVILNKRDLIDVDDEKYQHERVVCPEYYRSLGYEVLSIQTLRPTRKERHALDKVFADKISMVSGHSGVGKSSIVNLLDPQIVQDVEDEEILTKGRHTTSYASFIKLGVGGYIIDTPGIRSFTLFNPTQAQLANGFRDLREFAAECRYRECKHHLDEECGVKEAVAQGKLPAWRYDSYLGLLLGTTGREGRLREQRRGREELEEDLEFEEDGHD